MKTIEQYIINMLEDDAPKSRETPDEFHLALAMLLCYFSGLITKILFFSID